MRHEEIERQCKGGSERRLRLGLHSGEIIGLVQQKAHAGPRHERGQIRLGEQARYERQPEFELVEREEERDRRRAEEALRVIQDEDICAGRTCGAAAQTCCEQHRGDQARLASGQHQPEYEGTCRGNGKRAGELVDRLRMREREQQPRARAIGAACQRHRIEFEQMHGIAEQRFLHVREDGGQGEYEHVLQISQAHRADTQAVFRAAQFEGRGYDIVVPVFCHVVGTSSPQWP